MMDGDEDWRSERQLSTIRIKKASCDTIMSHAESEVLTYRNIKVTESKVKKDIDLSLFHCES